MAVFRRIAILAALAALTIVLTGCERTITSVTENVEPQNCFTCHSDQNTILVDAEQQWENSRHSTGSTLNENDSTCKGCHTSEGFIARAEGTTAPATIENPTAIHCFTCHAPHTNSDFRLRWTTPPPLANATTLDLGAANICVACHQARRNVATYVTATTVLTSRWGPHHSNQADLVMGTNGYQFAGYTYEQTEHRTAVGAGSGKDGCLECHFKATSQYVVGGHSFNMRGEVHAEEVLNIGACAPCHGEVDDFNEGIAGYAAQDRVDSLATELKNRLVTAGLLDATSGLPKSVTTSKDSAGAVWNYLFIAEDRSIGIHNHMYAVSLLQSAINYISGPSPQAAHGGLANR